LLDKFVYRNMNIGLVRHFKVDSPKYTKKLSTKEFGDTQVLYHSSDIIKHPVDLGNIKWQICYSSTLKRAKDTASYIFNGEIITTDLIVEVEASPAFNTKLKLSFFIWHVLARFAWLFGHKSQQENFKETKSRCRIFLNQIINSGKQNILIVSHGFFMREFAKILIRSGFYGKIDYAPKNAHLYLFTSK